MGHHLQGVLGPGVEPVDGAAVDEGGEHAQAVPEGVANGTHGCQGDRGGAKRDPGVEVTRARPTTHWPLVLLSSTKTVTEYAMQYL